MTHKQQSQHDTRLSEILRQIDVELDDIARISADAGGMVYRSVAVAPPCAYGLHARAMARRNAERKAGNQGAVAYFDASVYESATQKPYFSHRTSQWG